MTDSLRDQLLGLGFKPAPKPERTPDRKPGGKPQGRPQHAGQRPAGGKGEGRPHGGGKPGGQGRGPQSQQARPNEGGKPGGQSRPNRPARSREDIDLAKAYAIRAQREKDERIEAERLKQEEARLRREARAKVDALIEGKTLNDPAAEVVRHFPYGGKIKRIHVTAEQLTALNAGELGIVQQAGRYLLVTAALLDEVEALFAPAVALRVDPNATVEEDPYADPQYQVPDDLIW
ncbi:Uncharacterized conserved protein YaiL, DUF2058 family [Pseudoxanthomonas sp. GM95]|uniref:DUF2058 domain-containing protein n=1 Tax=Pseudoxanthomonas sp. GM95 TaxID=1881043 RepID=UPI0008CCB4B9|nr:DUF2058 family protein [Pseudoxanthomonas sp. GM95]SEL89996.1 Uncharacterized conserved protein YaiL, DUF2058 family [Pseudoxanthomonas sp. GM95]